MKVNSSIFLCSLVACLFLVQNVSAQYSVSIIGDIRIETLRNGSLYCDSMICPQGSSCHVTKKTDPNDLSVVHRTRTCLAPNGAVLQQETVNQENPHRIIENVDIVSGGGATVRQLTPEEQRQLEENLRHTQERVRAQVDNTLNRVYSSLAPIMDGSFARNLNNHIQEQVRNSIRF